MSFSERFGRATAWLKGEADAAPRREEPRHDSALFGSIEYELQRLARDVRAVALDGKKKPARLATAPVVARGAARFAAFEEQNIEGDDS